ncbi:cytochrome P450 [Stachybotrys elegans]|uniref:Cytochrome P450 n=1 Tax=Stachybotrys elegans TaxID=80388 RepID=A0A8K0SU10_9HYPO|nr:cytochrome P450 [Stachybotrys elegans]
MLLDSSPRALSTSVAYAVVAAVIGKIAWQWFRLRRIPGPFLAKLTNLPRAYWVWSRRPHEIHIELHEKHGHLVRFGPNMVSAGNAQEVDKIYRLHSPLGKACYSPDCGSDFYHVILPMSKGKILPGLFATQDEGIHRMLKRPIGGIYSMSNLTSFESLVDATIEAFMEQLDKRFVKTRAVCDWGLWLQYFAFDVVGEITFSTRLGFLEHGKDIDGIMDSIWRWFQYVAVVGQIPWVDYLWVKNPIVSRLRPASWSPMVAFAVKQQNEREAKMAAGEPVNSKDFLSRFLAAMEKDPSIPKWALTAWTSSNVLAGSDTTAIFLRTLFKNLGEHPQTLQKLRAEIDAARARGELSRIVTWKESRRLPYLEACIQEAGRIHPPFGLNLERVVPAGGIEISGEHIPEGTIVGMNAWVVHRDRQVFGADADKWRPERWIEADPVQRKKMDDGLLTFGAGHRTCLGKHISLLEIYKLVPTILQEYEFTFANPSKVWRVENRWFVPQFDFMAYISKRTLV